MCPKSLGHDSTGAQWIAPRISLQLSAQWSDAARGEEEGVRFSIDDIEAARDELYRVETEYLRERGWHHTSATPDHRWRWQRKINRVVYSLDISGALSVQRELDPAPDDEEADHA